MVHERGAGRFELKYRTAGVGWVVARRADSLAEVKARREQLSTLYPEVFHARTDWRIISPSHSLKFTNGAWV